MPGFTLDTGGLIALERGNRQITVLLDRSPKTNLTFTIPATALAKAIRRPERQAQLARFVHSSQTEVIALNQAEATNVGHLLAATGTADVVDAHVVLCARRRGQPVITSDPDDLRQLDPAIEIIPCLTLCPDSVSCISLAHCSASPAAP